MNEIYRGIWVVAYRELLRFVQERSRMVTSFAFPIMFLVVFGAGFNRIVGPMTEGVDFIQFMYPGILSMTVVMSSMFSGMSIVWDREFGFLKEILVAPISRSGIVLGKALGGSVTAMLQGVILLILAPFLGIHLTALMVVKYIFLVLLLSLSLSGMGIFVATRMRSQQGFQMVMNLLIFPLIFLSGVFFPVDNVPPWLQMIAKLNPLTYGVDAIRQVFLSGHAGLGVTVMGYKMGIIEDALIIGVLGLSLLSVSVWSFSRQE
jgi:ABC-2 type transport system permease protein